jgi:hypothetical protein
MGANPKRFPPWLRWAAIVVGVFFGLFLLVAGCILRSDRAFADAKIQAEKVCRLIMESSMAANEATELLKQEGFNLVRPSEWVDGPIGRVEGDETTFLLTRDFSVLPVLREVHVAIKYAADRPVSCEVDQSFGAP